MTTTNIAGINIPDDLVSEAANLADELKSLFARLMPMLDQAAKVNEQIEESDRARVPRWSDEQLAAVWKGTALKRIHDVWYELDARTRVAI